MKKIIFSCLLIVSVGMLSFVRLDELPIGADLPKADVKLKDISGRDISFHDAIRKNGLLVMFSCNTCPYVIKNQARTQAICQYALENNIGVVLVNSNEAQRAGDDSFEAMQEYARSEQYKWFYVVDRNSEMADVFGARRTPEIYLFNRENKLVYRGAIDDNPADEGNVKRNHAREAIREILEGKEVTVKTSRSVGCSIKRL